MEEMYAVVGMLMTGTIGASATWIWTRGTVDDAKTKFFNERLTSALAEQSLRSESLQRYLTVAAAVATTRREDLDQFLADLHWKVTKPWTIRHQGIFNTRYFVRFEAELYFRTLLLTPIPLCREIFVGNEIDKKRIDLINGLLIIGTTAAGLPPVHLAAKLRSARSSPNDPVITDSGGPAQ